MHKAVEQASGGQRPLVRKVKDHAVVGYPGNLHVNHEEKDAAPRRLRCMFHDPPAAQCDVVDALVGAVPVRRDEPAQGVASSDLEEGVKEGLGMGCGRRPTEWSRIEATAWVRGGLGDARKSASL